MLLVMTLHNITKARLECDIAGPLLCFRLYYFNIRHPTNKT